MEVKIPGKTSTGRGLKCQSEPEQNQWEKGCTVSAAGLSAVKETGKNDSAVAFPRAQGKLQRHTYVDKTGKANEGSMTVRHCLTRKIIAL